MRAILMILMITDTSDFPTKHEIGYKLVSMEKNIDWDDCSYTAIEINSKAPIEVGNVTATCFPYVAEDGTVSERSRPNP